MKLGIMGGTFNPPHLGHLRAAQTAKERLELDKVLFIPTNMPPHKSLPKDTARPEQRCEMVRLMTQNLPWAEVSEIEIERGGASYTVETLRELVARGYDDITLIVGTDMLLSFDSVWREPQEICRLCTLAVCARNVGEKDEIAEKEMQLKEMYRAHIVVLETDPFPISSTELRKSGKLHGYVPQAVEDYILCHRLYR